MVSEIKSFFAEDVSAFSRTLSRLDSLVDPLADAQADERLNELRDAIGRSKQACRGIEAFIGDDQPLLKDTQERFRQSIAEWFDRS